MDELKGKVTVEKVAAYGALIAVVLFATGALVQNVELASLGISDFGDLQVRYISVGLAYWVYLLLPIVLLVLPLAVLRFSAFDLTFLFRIFVSTFLFLFLFWMLPIPFHYFLPDFIEWSPYTTWRLWSVYNIEYGGNPLMIVMIAPLGFLADWFFSVWIKDKSYRFLRCAVTVPILPLIAFSLVVPYAWNVYPNLSRAVGGGQLIIAQLVVGEAAKPFPTTMAASQPVKRVPLDDQQAVIIWHENDQFIFVSVPKASGEAANTSHFVAIRRDLIKAIIYSKQRIRIWNGIPEIIDGAGQAGG
ncbi:MAG TPA: hypothetical protein VF595_02545 [Tepidisphaeraceae bacterium]|jgi:hypothetical protein